MSAARGETVDCCEVGNPPSVAALSVCGAPDSATTAANRAAIAMPLIFIGEAPVKVALPRLLRKVEGETAYCRNTLIALSEIGVRDQVKAEGDQYLELEWAETGESTGVDGRKNRCCTRRWARSGPRWLGAPSVIGVLALCVISPGGSLGSLAIALSPVCLQNSGRLK